MWSRRWGRTNDETGVARAHESHEDEVLRLLPGPVGGLCRGAVAVGESGLVAVMPIGHINGFVGEGGAQRLHGVRLVDDA